jgi:hypothetical protein
LRSNNTCRDKIAISLVPAHFTCICALRSARRLEAGYNNVAVEDRVSNGEDGEDATCDIEEIGGGHDEWLIGIFGSILG